MVERLSPPPTQVRTIASTLKQAVDTAHDETVDTGYWYVDPEHPVLGRPAAGTVVERVPGPVVQTTELPEDRLLAVIVQVGYVDRMTGDVRLGSGETLERGEGEPLLPESDGEVAGDPQADPPEPAVALFAHENRAAALPGLLLQGDDGPVFRVGGMHQRLERAIVRWVRDTADALPQSRGTAGANSPSRRR